MATENELRVHLRHCVGPDRRYCAWGMRRFAKRHGLNLRELTRTGIPIGLLEATGDGMALRAANNARKEAGII